MLSGELILRNQETKAAPSPKIKSDPLYPGLTYQLDRYDNDCGFLGLGVKAKLKEIPKEILRLRALRDELAQDPDYITREQLYRLIEILLDEKTEEGHLSHNVICGLKDTVKRFYHYSTEDRKPYDYFGDTFFSLLKKLKEQNIFHPNVILTIFQYKRETLELNYFIETLNILKKHNLLSAENLQRIDRLPKITSSIYDLHKQGLLNSITFNMLYSNNSNVCVTILIKIKRHWNEKKRDGINFADLDHPAVINLLCAYPEEAEDIADCLRLTKKDSSINKKNLPLITKALRIAPKQMCALLEALPQLTENLVKNCEKFLEEPEKTIPRLLCLFIDNYFALPTEDNMDSKIDTALKKECHDAIYKNSHLATKICDALLELQHLYIEKSHHSRHQIIMTIINNAEFGDHIGNLLKKTRRADMLPSYYEFLTFFIKHAEYAENTAHILAFFKQNSSEKYNIDFLISILTSLREMILHQPEKVAYLKIFLGFVRVEINIEFAFKMAHYTNEHNKTAIPNLAAIINIVSSFFAPKFWQEVLFEIYINEPPETINNILFILEKCENFEKYDRDSYRPRINIDDDSFRNICKNSEIVLHNILPYYTDVMKPLHIYNLTGLTFFVLLPHLLLCTEKINHQHLKKILPMLIEQDCRPDFTLPGIALHESMKRIQHVNLKDIFNAPCINSTLSRLASLSVNQPTFPFYHQLFPRGAHHTEMAESLIAINKRFAENIQESKQRQIAQKKNLERVAMLIAFVRANADNPLACSVLPLLKDKRPNSIFAYLHAEPTSPASAATAASANAMAFFPRVEPLSVAGDGGAKFDAKDVSPPKSGNSN